MNWKHSCVLLAVFAAIYGAGIVNGQESVDWLSGRKLDLQARQAAVSIDWQHAPLRQRLREFAANQQISIFLDRRIDGSQEIQFSAVNVSFEQLLWRLCDRIDAGMCRVENTYYIGPKDSAAALPEILKGLKKSVSSSTNSRLKRRWQSSSELSLPRRSEPGQKLEEIFKVLSCETTGLEQVPHDLWAETQIADSSATLRVALLLTGFDKTVKLAKDLRTLEVVELVIPNAISREFQAGDKAKTAATMIANEFPDLKSSLKRRSVLVEGSVEQVLAVHRKLVAMQQPEIPGLSDQTFDLKVDDQRLAILNSMARQVSRKLKYQPEHEMLLRGRVKWQLDGATANQIIEKSLEGTGLTFRFTDDALEILTK